MNNQSFSADFYSLCFLMGIRTRKHYNACKWCTVSGKNHRVNQCGSKENCSLDMIHHFLQKSDALEIELVAELESIDAKRIHSSQCEDSKNQSMLTRYIKFISDEMGIDDLLIEQANGISIRRLGGNEKVQFYEKIDLLKLIPHDIFESNLKIQSVNDQFFRILSLLKLIENLFL